MATPLHFATANDAIGSGSGSSELIAVSVNTGAASAVLTIYNGTATTDPVVAVIDATSKSSHIFSAGNTRCVLKKGVFAKLTGGNADCTVVVN